MYVQGTRFDARIIVHENARHHISFPPDLSHCDSLQLLKALHPGESSYSLGKLYQSVFSEKLKDAHDATADVAAVARLLLTSKSKSRGKLSELAALIDQHSESIGHIQKRCQKGR